MRNKSQAMPLLPMTTMLDSEAEETDMRVKTDHSRRNVLASMVGVAVASLARVALADPAFQARTTSSTEGIIRTTLESYVDESGNEFNLLLDTFPPGIVIPPHHHPTVGLNYVLEGVAESQYEGETMKRIQAGQTFQDHANLKHIMFRNPDKEKPVKILISFMVKKGQRFFQLD